MIALHQQHRHDVQAAPLRCRTSRFGSAESQACLQQALDDVLVVDAVCMVRE